MNQTVAMHVLPTKQIKTVKNASRSFIEFGWNDNNGLRNMKGSKNSYSFVYKNNFDQNKNSIKQKSERDEGKQQEDYDEVVIEENNYEDKVLTRSVSYVKQPRSKVSYDSWIEEEAEWNLKNPDHGKSYSSRENINKQARARAENSESDEGAANYASQESKKKVSQINSLQGHKVWTYFLTD